MNTFSIVSRRALTGLAIVGCLLAAAAGALRADGADFYRGDTITLVVGYGAGGGYDAYARLLAPWIEQRTGATVVVENRTGGGGLVALNQVYAADKDGRTIMIANGRAAVMGQLVGIEGVRFDLLDMPILGRLSAEPSVVLLSARSPLKSLDDLVATTETVKWAGGGKTDSIADSAACLSAALDIDSRIILGYKGSKEAQLATMRGEVDLMVTTDTTASIAAANRDLIPLAVLDRERSRFLPDLPTIFEAVALDDGSAWWIDFWADIARVGRVLVTTPGVPAERVEYLREVFASIVDDRGFVAEVQAANRLINYLDAPSTESLVRKTLDTLSSEERETVRTTILEKYY